MLDRKSEPIRNRIQLRRLPLRVFRPESGHAIPITSWNYVDVQVKNGLTRRRPVGLDDV